MSNRIAIITDKIYPFFTGGYEIRLFEIARLLSDDFQIEVFSCYEGNIKNIKINKISPTISKKKTGKRNIFQTMIFSFSLLKNPLKKGKFDYIIIESIPYFHLLSIRKWIKKEKGLKILDAPEIWYFYPYLKIPVLKNISIYLYRKILNKTLDLFDYILVMSTASKNTLIDYYRVKEEKIILIPNGTFNSNYKLNQEKKYYDFVYINRLTEIKRPMDIIYAAYKLKKDYGWNGKIAMVGDGELLKKIRKKIKELNLDNNIYVLGYLNEVEKIEILKKSKVFVLSSEREGFSISCLEAISFGLPLIASKPKYDELFGHRDLIIENYNGLTYPAGNIEELKNKMWGMLNIPDEKYMEFSKNSLELSKNFKWEKIINNLKNLLEVKP